MPPADNMTDELIGVYKEQIAQKDNQIALLTQLLKESNLRLAQQQSLLENLVTTGRSSDPSLHPPSPAVPAEIPVVEAIGESRQDTVPRGARSSEAHEAPGKAPPLSADAADVTPSPISGHTASAALPMITSPPEIEKPHAHETRDSVPPPGDKPASGDDIAHSPIPIAYFNSPLAGGTQGLKDAAAAKREINRLGDGRDSDARDLTEPEPRYPATEEYKKEPDARRLVPTLVAVAVVSVAAVIWVLSRILSAPGTRGAAISHPPLPNPGMVRQNPAPGPPKAQDLPPLASKAVETTAGPQVAQEPDQAASAPSSTAATGPLDAELLRAVSNSNHSLAKRLIRKGANVNASNDKHNSALALAAQKGDAAMVRLLLAKGANVDAANDVGWNPLLVAANSKYSSIVKTLLQHGARADAANTQGTTALMLAAKHGDTETVRLLLASGAPVLTKNKNGQSAIDFSSKAGNYIITDMLTEVTKPKQ